MAGVRESAMLGPELQGKGSPMPPHCDSMDGPVVTAARRALEAHDATIALAYVPEQGEEEVRRAFDAALRIRDQGPAVRDVADLHFFETLVRVHRAGEGAPYTGLKPAGLGHGPVVPVAEAAVEGGSPDRLITILSAMVEEVVRERFDRVMHLKAHANGNVAANRAYVAAVLGFEVWSHSLYEAIHAEPHEHAHVHV